MGSDTRFDTVFEPYGNDNLGFYAVSPNGRVASGWLAGPPFRTSMLWTDGVPRPLTLPTEEPATLTGAVTDSGFAGGTKPDALPIGRGFLLTRPGPRPLVRRFMEERALPHEVARVECHTRRRPAG